MLCLYILFIFLFSTFSQSSRSDNFSRKRGREREARDTNGTKCRVSSLVLAHASHLSSEIDSSVHCLTLFLVRTSYTHLSTFLYLIYLFSSLFSWLHSQFHSQICYRFAKRLVSLFERCRRWPDEVTSSACVFCMVSLPVVATKWFKGKNGIFSIN